MKNVLFKISVAILCLMFGMLIVISFADPENGKKFAVIIAILLVTFLTILKTFED